MTSRNLCNAPDNWVRGIVGGAPSDKGNEPGGKMSVAVESSAGPARNAAPRRSRGETILP